MSCDSSTPWLCSSVDATNRAAARKGASSSSKIKRLYVKHGDATVLPVLNEELTIFKAIARDIMHREASFEEGSLFKAEKRDKIRRLAGLGVLAHQPAFAAYCEVGDEERGNFIRCIMQQKDGPNAKVLKPVDEHLRRIQEARGLSAPGSNASDTLRIKN